MTAEQESESHNLTITLSGGRYVHGEIFVGWKFSEPVTRIHLTPAEARDMAAKMIDAADRIEAAVAGTEDTKIPLII